MVSSVCYLWRYHSFALSHQYVVCNTGSLILMPLPITYSAVISTVMYDMTQWWMVFQDSFAYSVMVLALHFKIVLLNSTYHGWHGWDFEYVSLYLEPHPLPAAKLPSGEFHMTPLVISQYYIQLIIWQSIIWTSVEGFPWHKYIMT